MSWFRWFRPNVRDRLAPYNLRPDVLAAASAMASDQRSDVYVAKLQSSLTDSETVLRMMDGRYAREMGLLVLTSERILFRSRRSSGATAFSVPAARHRGYRGLHPQGIRNCPTHDTGRQPHH